MTFSKDPRKMKPFLRVISIILVHTFLISSITFAAPQETTTAVTAKEVVTDPEKIVIPKEYGMIKSKFSGNSDRLIVHIQDAHCNYEAQSNIAKMLEALIKNDGLKFVAVEGADGAIDTSWFKAFPDEAVRKEVADYFMKKGEITGPEFLSITTDYPIKLFGAETRAYYLQNLNAFTSSYSLKDETEKYFKTIKAALDKLKGFVYSDELRLIDSKDADYKAKKLQFNEYVRFLQAEAEKNRINLRQFDNLFKLVNVLIYEKKIDFNVTDTERTNLIDDLTKKLSKDGVNQLVTQSISFKIGKISSAEYYNYLKNLAMANSIDLAKEYPNLYNYMIYNSVYSKIENEKLFHDITKAETAIKEKLFKNDDQRTLERLSRHIDTLIGLVNIELLNGDFEYFKNNKGEFTTEAFSGFIGKKTTQYGLAIEIPQPSESVATSITKLEDFYAIAIKRDKALVDNALAEMDKEGERIAVLVTGGFHSEGIAKLLEKQGVSYLVVCPSITKDVPTPYIQVLTNQRTSFEDIVMGAAEPAKQGMIAAALATWAFNLNSAEMKAILDSVEGYAGFPVRIDNIVEGWLKRHSKDWLENRQELIKRWREANPGRATDIKEIMKEEFKKAVRRSAAERGISGEKLEKTEKILSSSEFNKGFDAVYARIAPDISVKEKMTGAPAGNIKVDEAIRNAEAILPVFQNGEVPQVVPQKYAVLVDILRKHLHNLTEEEFGAILKDAEVPLDSPLAKAFTKANLLKALEKGYGKEGKGLTIKLIQPGDDVPGLTKPGIVMSPQGSNFGHYSINNDAVYLPWRLMDILIDKLTAGDRKFESYIAAEIAHELSEYTILTVAYPTGRIDVSEIQDVSAQAHFIAQNLEIALVGQSIARLNAPRSALDNLIEEIDRKYFADLKNRTETIAAAAAVISERHERMGRDYLEGRLTVPVESFDRMLRMNDVSVTLSSMDAARRRDLLVKAIDYFLNNKGKKIAITLLVAGEASRMQKGDYIPPILTEAQASEPERFGKVERDSSNNIIDTTPQAKALLPAAKVGGRYVSFLEIYLANISRMNNIFTQLGLGRPFIPKLMDNAKYHPMIMKELERVAPRYGFDAKEVLVFQQPLGWRVAATAKAVEEHKSDFVEKFGQKTYDDAYKYAKENEGRPIYDIAGVAEGHGEYYHSQLMPIQEYPGRTMFEVSRELGVDYDWVRNVDNMALLDENWLALFGYMLEQNNNMLFEVSLRSEGPAGKGGSFFYDGLKNIKLIEDDVYAASASENHFNRAADESTHNPNGNNPSPINNASFFTRIEPVFQAVYGENGELDRALAMTDDTAKAAALAELQQAGRRKFGIVPTFKIVKGKDGYPIGTIIFETRMGDMYKGAAGKVSLATTSSAEDIRTAMSAQGLPVNDSGLVETMTGLDNVRFDSLKEKADYGDQVLQTVRQALTSKAVEGELVSEPVKRLIVSRRHQLDPTELETKIRTRAEEIYQSRRRNNVPGDQKTDWEQAKEDVTIEIASGKKTTGSVGAVRLKGGELPAAEHGTRGARGAAISAVASEKSVNGAIASRISSGMAYMPVNSTIANVNPEDVNIEVRDEPIETGLTGTQRDNYAKLQELLESMPVNLVIIRGLRDELIKRGVAPDLIFHPGVARNAVYIDEADLLHLLSFQNGLTLIKEAIDHELAHIKNPKLPEEAVEKTAPTNRVREALEAWRAEASKKPEEIKVLDEVLRSIEAEKWELQKTLNLIPADMRRKIKPVILAVDTAMDPNAIAAIQEGESVIKHYLGGTVAEVRATGKTLLENLRIEAQAMAQRLGCDVKDISIVTISGNKSLSDLDNAIIAEVAKGDQDTLDKYYYRGIFTAEDIAVIKKIADGQLSVDSIGPALPALKAKFDTARQRNMGTVLNVQNQNNRYIPVIGLYDVALRIAYKLSDEENAAIADRLNMLRDPNSPPFTADDLKKGVIPFLPKTGPANLAEAVEAYKAAQQALQSL